MEGKSQVGQGHPESQFGHKQDCADAVIHDSEECQLTREPFAREADHNLLDDFQEY